MLVGLVAVLVMVGGWWWLERSTRPDVSDDHGPDQVRVIADKPSVPTLKSEEPPAGGGVPSENATPDEAPAANQSEMAASGGEMTATPAEPLTAGDILAEPDDNYVRVAKKLSALVLDSRAPMENREEALAHALNLSAGNEAEVLTPLATNPELPDNLTETILAEALNRPLAYQAELYLAALSVKKSPEMQKLIRDHLAFLTGGEDLGSDPKAWVGPLNAAKSGWSE